MTTIGSFEARTHFSDLLRRVENGGEQFVLTVRGKPVAILGPVAKETTAQELAGLLDELRRLRAQVAARGPVLRSGETWKSFARKGLDE
ncbi:MAG TPA: type II toxin-antitoxin system Phd/YefM family antitoxin [Chthoniobacterales bacterium]